MDCAWSSLRGAKKRVRVNVEQVRKASCLRALGVRVQTSQTRKACLILHSFSFRIVLVVDGNAPCKLIHLRRSEDTNIAEVVNTLRARLIRGIAQGSQTRSKKRGNLKP